MSGEIKGKELESNQHYGEESPYLNPPDHPFESQGEESRVEESRGECKWLEDGMCTNEKEFFRLTKVNGGYCSVCEEYTGREEEEGGNASEISPRPPPSRQRECEA